MTSFFYIVSAKVSAMSFLSVIRVSFTLRCTVGVGGLRPLILCIADQIFVDGVCELIFATNCCHDSRFRWRMYRLALNHDCRKLDMLAVLTVLLSFFSAPTRAEILALHSSSNQVFNRFLGCPLVLGMHAMAIEISLFEN